MKNLAPIDHRSIQKPNTKPSKFWQEPEESLTVKSWDFYFYRSRQEPELKTEIRETNKILTSIHFLIVILIVSVWGILLLLNARMPSNQSTQTKPNQIINHGIYN